MINEMLNNLYGLLVSKCADDDNSLLPSEEKLERIKEVWLRELCTAK